MLRLTGKSFVARSIARSSLCEWVGSSKGQRGGRWARFQSTSSGPFGLHVVSTKAGPPPGAPYSQAIKAGSQIWVSGQLPTDESGKLIEGTIAEKTAQCCKNVIAVVEAGGSSVDKVVRVGVFLTDMKDFAEMNSEYAKWFKHKPARACVAVHQLPLGVPVEIEAIAVV